MSVIKRGTCVVAILSVLSLCGCSDDTGTNPQGSWSGTGTLRLVRILEEWDQVTMVGEPPDQGYYLQQIHAPLDYLVVGTDSVTQHHFYYDCYEHGSFAFTLDGTSITSLYDNYDSLEVTVHYEPRGTEVDFRITYRDYSADFPGLEVITYTYVPSDDPVPPAAWVGDECGSSYEPWGDYL